MSNSIITITCLVGAGICFGVLAVAKLTPYCRAVRSNWWIIPVAIIATLWAGTKPPVVVVKDIEIKSIKCDHTGCEITWACGTNIMIGVDKFIVLRATRQIPSRTGWSAFEKYGESMTTNWATATPQHAHDTLWMVVVRKEQE